MSEVVVVKPDESGSESDEKEALEAKLAAEQAEKETIEAALKEEQAAKEAEEAKKVTEETEKKIDEAKSEIEILADALGETNGRIDTLCESIQALVELQSAAPEIEPEVKPEAAIESEESVEIVAPETEEKSAEIEPGSETAPEKPAENSRKRFLV